MFEQKENLQGFIMCESMNGGPQIWHQSFNPKPSTNISASPLPTVNPIPIGNPSGQNCQNLGTSTTYDGSTYECRFKSGANKAYVLVTDKNNAPRDLVGSSQTSLCKIRDQRAVDGGGGSTGFPMERNLIKASGSVKVAVIPITYPDSKTPEDTVKFFKPTFDLIDQRNQYLYGDRIKYEWTIIPNWLMMPLESKYFAWDHPTVQADGTRKSDGQAQLISDSEQTFHIFSAAEKFININDFDFFWIMSNPLEAKVRFSGYGRNRNITTATKTYLNKNYYGFGYASLGAEKALHNGRMGTLSDTIAHEMAHFHGMVQHAPGNGWGWFVSSNPSWESWLAGWRTDDQIACFDSTSGFKEGSLYLSSMDLNSTGYKAAVVKVSSTEALIVESRRKGPYMSTFADGFAGITVTHFDATKSGERWDGNFEKEKDYYLYFLRINQTRASTNHPAFEFLGDENIVAFEGESFTYNGVTISLVESGSYDKIRISKD
ncbi:MAG: hypothetical protein ACO24D_18025 [bacterium]